VSECRWEITSSLSVFTLEPVGIRKLVASGETESYLSISDRGDCLQFKGDEEEDVSESEFLHVLLHPRPESPKI
jgi:hypothetical protein